MAAPVLFKTVSERLFAEYLDEAKYTWEYEPVISGHTKRPDFRVWHDGREFFCDVKQRDPNSRPTGLIHIDPFPGVRELIRRGRDTFRDFDSHLCAVVVFNEGDFNTRLEPFGIFGAMLGELGKQFSFTKETATLDSDSAMSVFLRQRGVMIKRYQPLEIYESAKNISAVTTLETHSPLNPDFQDAQAEEESKRAGALGRPLTDDEANAISYKLIEQGLRCFLPDRKRVIVCLNPFARWTFPEHLFKGEYDERWAIVNGSMQRVWAGGKCAPLYDEEKDDDEDDW